MKFGDDDNAMEVSSIASRYHPWLLSPRGLHPKLELLELWKSVFGPCP